MYKEKLNPDANAKNLLQLNKGESGCCGESATACKYVFAGVTGTFNQMIVKNADGNNVTYSASPALSEPEAIRSWIHENLVAAGLIDVTDEYSNIIVKSPFNTIEVISQRDIVSVRYAATTVAAVKKCVASSVCKFSVFVAYDTDPGKMSTITTGGTQIGTTGGWSTGEAATCKTDVQTALTAEGFAFDSVIATENTVYDGFNIDIYLVGNGPIYVDGAQLVDCVCRPDFAA